MLLSIRDLQAIAKSRAQEVAGNSDSIEYRSSFMTIFHTLTMACANNIGTFAAPYDEADNVLVFDMADNGVNEDDMADVADNISVPDTVIVTDTDSSSSSDSDSDPDADQDPEFKE